MTKRIFLILTILMHSAYSLAATEYYITLSKLNNSQVTHKTVLSILRAEKLTWESGVPVVLIVNDLSKITNDLFISITSMSKNQFLELWRIKFFSGRAFLPKQVKSINEVIDTIEENSNAIYVSMDSTPQKEIIENTNLKTIKILADF